MSVWDEMGKAGYYYIAVLSLEDYCKKAIRIKPAELKEVFAIIEANIAELEEKHECMAFLSLLKIEREGKWIDGYNAPKEFKLFGRNEKEGVYDTPVEEGDL